MILILFNEKSYMCFKIDGLHKLFVNKSVLDTSNNIKMVY